MDMDCSQLTQHIQRLVDKKTVAVFAKEIGVSRQTVYGLLAGNLANSAGYGEAGDSFGLVNKSSGDSQREDIK